MTTYDYILQVIQAQNPCSLKHVIWDCKQQGFTKGFVKALQTLKDDHLIFTEHEDNETTVYLT
jgi:hypothetical protein